MREARVHVRQTALDHLLRVRRISDLTSAAVQADLAANMDVAERLVFGNTMDLTVPEPGSAADYAGFGSGIPPVPAVHEDAPAGATGAGTDGAGTIPDAQPSPGVAGGTGSKKAK